MLITDTVKIRINNYYYYTVKTAIDCINEMPHNHSIPAGTLPITIQPLIH